MPYETSPAQLRSSVLAAGTGSGLLGPVPVSNLLESLLSFGGLPGVFMGQPGALLAGALPTPDQVKTTAWLIQVPGS